MRYQKVPFEHMLLTEKFYWIFVIHNEIPQYVCIEGKQQNRGSLEVKRLNFVPSFQIAASWYQMQFKMKEWEICKMHTKHNIAVKMKMNLQYFHTRKYLLRRYILGVLMDTTALDRHWVLNFERIKLGLLGLWRCVYCVGKMFLHLHEAFWKN